MFIGEKINIQFTLNNILDMISRFLPLVFIVVTITMYYISYKVAYKIYAKKEI